MKRATPFDKKLGQLIRARRKVCKLSQTEVANRAGDITFQQMQKYENGTNRVTVGRFVKICGVLDVHPMVILGPAMAWAKTRRQKVA